MKTFAWAFIGLLATFSATASAQHADIRPYVYNDRIHTAAFVDATSVELPNVRVFGYEFGEDADEPYFAQDPGFNAASGSGLPVGSQLLLNIVGADSLGLPANLSFWDGAGAVNFAPPPADESLTLNFGSQSCVADSSSGFVAGFNLQTVAASGAVHRHLNAFLNGGASEPPLGVYLLSLELASSADEIEESLPFYIVYNNGLSEDAHDMALGWVQDNLVVPEPSSTLLITVATLAIGGNCRRQRRP
jgi:hypothetical protein